MFYLIKTQNGDVIGRLELASDLTVEPEQAAPASAPPPPPAQREQKTMLPAAGDFSYETYVAQGWSDAALVNAGLMRIDMVPMENQDPVQDDGPAVHPSVQNAPLGDEWQPAPPPPAPEPQQPVAPPPPPAPEPQQAPPPPPAPEPQQAPPPPPPAPEPQQAPPPPPPAPEPAQDPVAPPPPPAAPVGQSAPQETGGAGAPELPEGCNWLEGDVPRIQGREFIIRDVSWERCQDADGYLFDGRIHGVTKENVPSTKKDGTFTKKRGIDKDYYAQLMVEQDRILRPRAAQPEQTTPAAAPPPPQGAPVPPPPPGGGVPAPPPPPGMPESQGPQTAPPPPENMKALDEALKDWGEET